MYMHRKRKFHNIAVYKTKRKRKEISFKFKKKILKNVDAQKYVRRFSENFARKIKPKRASHRPERLLYRWAFTYIRIRESLDEEKHWQNRMEPGSARERLVHMFRSHAEDRREAHLKQPRLRKIYEPLHTLFAQ